MEGSGENLSSSITFAFFDESAGTFGGREFVAVTALLLPIHSLNDFRKSLIAELTPVLSGGERRVDAALNLHANNMLPDPRYRDEDRWSVYRIFSEHILKFNAKIFRLGYFCEVGLNLSLREERKVAFNLALHFLRQTVSSLTSGAICYVYELDKSKHESIQGTWNDTVWHLSRPFVSDNALTVNLDQIIGSFYADKKNVFMQATDIASWFLLQLQNIFDEQDLRIYKKKAIEYMRPLLPCVKLDKIIQMNQEQFSDKHIDYLGVSG